MRKLILAVVMLVSAMAAAEARGDRSWKPAYPTCHKEKGLQVCPQAY